MKKVIPADIGIRITDQGAKAVILTITDVGGDKTMIPLTVDLATEVGKELLAGVLALGGSLVTR